MSIEILRAWLYPLGFLASIAFTSRFILQWIESEYKKKSVVSPLFWILSIIGNVVLVLHSIIQMQFHVGIVQSCNSIISYRNLNLMNPSSSQLSFKTVIKLFIAAILSITAIFILQGYLFSDGKVEWFRIPSSGWEMESSSISIVWHLLGTLGIILFSARFWVQWWKVETLKYSHLSRSFWWLSCIGAILSLAYFVMIGDLVNLVGPAFGMVPYIRNLALINKERKLAKTL